MEVMQGQDFIVAGVVLAAIPAMEATVEIKAQRGVGQMEMLGRVAAGVAVLAAGIVLASHFLSPEPGVAA